METSATALLSSSRAVASSSCNFWHVSSWSCPCSTCTYVLISASCTFSKRLWRSSYCVTIVWKAAPAAVCAAASVEVANSAVCAISTSSRNSVSSSCNLEQWHWLSSTSLPILLVISVFLVNFSFNPSFSSSAAFSTRCSRLHVSTSVILIVEISCWAAASPCSTLLRRSRKEMQSRSSRWPLRWPCSTSRCASPSACVHLSSDSCNCSHSPCIVLSMRNALLLISSSLSVSFWTSTCNVSAMFLAWSRFCCSSETLEEVICFLHISRSSSN
mmetsp:Transcript_64800/g.150679  ORF Transcript_64800/g.150679 Transcript_64800/m.150679 type:complete len:272 (-) Transcript_64800:323-1138(-)